MARISDFVRGFLLSLVFALGASVAQAENVTVIHAFSGDNKDGASPIGNLVLGSGGAIYGALAAGGSERCECGAVFEIQPKTGKQTVLHVFSGNSDGNSPSGGLIMDSAGNLYGVTQDGGKNSDGAVYMITAKGKESVLYAFCSKKNCTDGSSPFGTLVVDKSGNVFGTTSIGGALNQGTIFEIPKNGVETVLYSFKGGNKDGSDPRAGLIEDSHGNLFGTTEGGGPANCAGLGCGTVFEFTKAGKEKVVYNFCTVKKCTDGVAPQAGVIEDSAGNLYGTTSGGGTREKGTIFKVAPNGKETLLYSFCIVNKTAACADGAEPLANLYEDASGNLYGSTLGGGADSQGVIFELLANGKEQVLHAFTGINDGAQPDANLIPDGSGNLYGTAQFNGKANGGVMFTIKP